MGDEDVVDIAILGAGTTGLAAAYYAGHRECSVRIIESLDRIGGQVATLYPEKVVYDVAGHPAIQGQALVDLCAEQGLQYGADVRLGEEVQTLQGIDADGEHMLAIGTSTGATYRSRAVIITAGHGAFEPRKLGLPGIDAWEGRGLHYAVGEKEAFRDKACVVVGGGDSALDWALGLQDTASRPVALVHRRDRFRAMESSVVEARRLAREGALRILTPYEVRGIHGNGRVEALTVENTAAGTEERVECDALITLLGYVSHLGAVADWGLELHGSRKIRIEPTTGRTSHPRVYAAGDVAWHPGKITLITVGMAEAAVAVNNAIAEIRGERVQPPYSTD